MSWRRVVGPVFAIGLGLEMLGCDTSVPTLPAPPTRLVVHAVLDPQAPTQVILLQESRAFQPGQPTSSFDPDDPIVSVGEVPVSNARVVLYAGNGDSAVAAEDRTSSPSGKGAGVYRIWSSSIVAPPASAVGAFLPVHPGEHYRLRITSRFGVAEGTTLVPKSSGPFESGGSGFWEFDPRYDSLRMRPTQAPAAGYLYRDTVGDQVLTFNDRFRRDLEQWLILPSANDDWGFAFARDLFVAGSWHMLSVTAVDSNYFAYYSTAFDPFASRSDQTALKGAIGLFGSVLPLFASGVYIKRQ
jgi:hypothetical protein